MAKGDKYIGLGEKASLFYDPSVALKILPGQAVKLTAKIRRSKKVSVALKGGHLERIDSEEISEYKVIGEENENKIEEKKSEEKVDKTPKPGDDNFETNEPEEGWDEKSLEKQLKPHLYNLALHYGTEVEEADLKGYNKDELVEEIMDLLTEEE